MITPEFVQTMARYNAWQNRQLADIVKAMDEDELIKDRGGVYGSILHTLNHLLWGDMIWMSRINPPYPKPGGGIAESLTYWPTVAAWSADRLRCDDHILSWAKGLAPQDLTGDLSWYSSGLGRQVVMPIALSVMHAMNHQTHDRGMIDAMLTAAGQPAAVSDLFAMPKET